jgi:hypothetical protein
MPAPQQTADTATDKLALAYAAVFGRDEEHRTEEQRLVMADMERRGYLRRSTAVALPSGEVSPVKMEIAEGMRIFLLDTLSFIDRANRLGEKKHKPNTKRT